MVLRESGRSISEEFNIDALVNPEQDSNVAGGRELLAFTDAVLRCDTSVKEDVLENARESLANQLGAAAVAGASLIIGSFTKNDRIANGIGIPADPSFLEASDDFRERLGLHNYPSAKNSFPD